MVPLQFSEPSTNPETGKRVGRYAFLGSGGGGGIPSAMQYFYGDDPSKFYQRGGPSAGRLVSVAYDDEIGGRLTAQGENRAKDLSNTDKYGRDGLGYYLKKGYVEPAQAQAQAQAPAYGRPSDPIDSVGRGTGLGKASMLPSKAGKYSFARPMGTY